MSESVNDRVQSMFKTLSEQTKGKFPPPFAQFLEGEFIEFERDRCQMKFPVKAAYNNPFGITFGGFFGMWIDNVMGPFSGYVAMAPTVSLDLHITYIKAVSPKDEFVIATANVVKLSKSYILLDARVTKEDGTLCATGTSRLKILDPTRM